ncbi:uncharacterized protein PITG_17904 [Phytophthora infestans T30-4]|uniref:Uncharacterized protein n=1 Tax=Phytophthora infestans (strain T30-4) TaxID=403677 RepID=D0NX88_PHYIT|nr:uncharacterized protein PITG_17904 [Phytophthora infestans T30-4]EEY67685.1 conserved hypothetical protein [Phytophthora infestans T30-4]|eukprot:XP_002896238.1 conserved hypothetical protein [Phytophthora infestans T30-4]
MDQWEKYTTFHRKLTFRLNTARWVDPNEDDPRCADTLKFLYPALFTQSRHNPHERAIVKTLVGSRGSLPTELVLHFDRQGHVFAFESRVNPSAAIHAHQSSIMTANGHWQAATDAEESARRERMLPRQLL